MLCEEATNSGRDARQNSSVWLKGGTQGRPLHDVFRFFSGILCVQDQGRDWTCRVLGFIPTMQQGQNRLCPSGLRRASLFYCLLWRRVTKMLLSYVTYFEKKENESDLPASSAFLNASKINYMWKVSRIISLSFSVIHSTCVYWV